MNPVIDMVRKICAGEARLLKDAEVVAPLLVWDGDGKSMGVQIKAPKLMGGKQECEVVAGFVLSQAELTSRASVRRKATLAAQAMLLEVQVQIKPVRAEKVA